MVIVVFWAPSNNDNNVQTKMVSKALCVPRSIISSDSELWIFVIVSPVILSNGNYCKQEQANYWLHPVLVCEILESTACCVTFKMIIPPGTFIVENSVWSSLIIIPDPTKGWHWNEMKSTQSSFILPLHYIPSWHHNDAKMYHLGPWIRTQIRTESQVRDVVLWSSRTGSVIQLSASYKSCLDSRL